MTKAERLLQDVGRRIAEVRQLRGWTQEDAAERLGLSVRMVRKIEAGANTSIYRLLLIAEKFGVSAGAFFEPPESRERRKPGRPAK